MCPIGIERDLEKWRHTITWLAQVNILKINSLFRISYLLHILPVEVPYKNI